MSTPGGAVVVVGGGVVGAATAFTLAHRGIETVLVEAEPELGLAASGTNSGILHTGFDSTPGELETELIVRAAALRPPVLEALGVPVARLGAELVPRSADDAATVAALARNAATNGVDVEVRRSDGALVVPGEWVTDPVAFTLALARSAEAAGARTLVADPVVTLTDEGDGILVGLAGGDTLRAAAVINCAGLHADDVARMLGDDSFEIYPRKGEFFVFRLPGGRTLDRIILPVPTKRTKGVLVFPTIDGHVVAGPTAVDLADKSDFSVRPEARAEVLAKAVEQFPGLDGLEPVGSYAGLRPAGRDANYVIGPSSVAARLINVAAIRSTGLSASLGIADHVLGLLPPLGIAVGERRPVMAGAPVRLDGLWWQRTARRVTAARAGSPS